MRGRKNSLRPRGWSCRFRLKPLCSWGEKKAAEDSQNLRRLCFSTNFLDGFVAGFVCADADRFIYR
jgi:hypothetical protein